MTFCFFFDGDGQYDPRDLFKVYCFLVNNDFDFVSGIRINRKDTFIRLLISKMVFFFRKIFFNDHFIDSGCGLKAFKKKCYKLYKLQDGDHRFINIILTKQGFTGGQINIKHRSRYAGKSKYNLLNRLISIYHFILLFFRYR